MKKHKYFAARLLFVTLFVSSCPGLMAEANFKSFVESIDSNSIRIHQYKMVHTFYQQNNFNLKWFSSNADSSNRNDLKYLIQHAELFALKTGDFHFELFSSPKALANAADSFLAEVTYTDAALSFMHNLAYGGDEGFVKYNGFNYHPDHFDLIEKLNTAFCNRSLKTTLTTVEPTSAKFAILKQAYLRLLMTSRSPGFKEIVLTSKEVSTRNNSLLNKLRQLGYIADTDTTTQGLQKGLRSLQTHHKLVAQNTINASCREVLNESIAHKLEELVWNIRWYRWLDGMAGESYLLVNLPANKLTFYQIDGSEFTCKIVVGKISTPTPTLTSVIKNVIYYPYWNVPQSIAVNEILPILRRNPGYLNRQRMEVLANGHVVSSVSWQSYSASNFPFQFRQKTGCGNSLGLLKFDFENPFHVYLHDTNAKGAFSSSQRFFSHGCMRVEKPYDLAIMLGVDSTRIPMKPCLENKKPEIIPLPKSIPVFVIYATIDVLDGELYWYEDAYRKINR